MTGPEAGSQVVTPPRDAQAPGAEVESAAPVRVSAPPPAAPKVYEDVWSWTAPKYRFRAIALLSLNLGLYIALCVFTHYLHVGRALEFTFDSYLTPARFWGEGTQSLYDFILYPISVEQNPVHGVVIGLLLASIAAVPIATAVTYRLPSAIPFCAVVLIFAHLPWLSLTLVASCVLASVRPFRLKFRYGAALVGLLPVLLYIFLATLGGTDLLSASISPERKLLLAGPWLLAILAACVMLAVILFLAQLVNYRPGAVSPVMAVMFVTPVLLFQRYVGFDELSYRTLELKYGPRSTRFEPVQNATDTILRFFRERMESTADTSAQRAVLLALWNEDAQRQAEIKHRVSNSLLVKLLADRQAAYDACEEFLATHLHSRFTPNVLYIQARALDTRLDELRVTGEQAQRELYTDFPHVQSERPWTALLTQFADSPLAVAARLRLAQLRMREGRIEEALAALELPAAPPRSAPPRRAAADPSRPEATLDFEPDEFIFQADRLRELILANSTADGMARDRAALQALGGLDPHREGYRRQLARLAAEYADRPIHDNLVVKWASSHEDRTERPALLRMCLERYPDGDAFPEALFDLADLEVQTFGDNDTRRQAGIAKLQQLARDYAHTCWGRLAAERVAILRPTTVPATRAAETP
jgi:hypothetical protein